ncbi:CGNR zinc finger domain-containing protein [Bordetella genomosp. 13]|uniref:CGNR zinc finger domain-containing protein n=1 Tax=Bordetella genomosp. 13 TaxID=463040 RepID=UPI0021B62D34|nr:ABATE domain-containing protein [Bordetella genomosp. 13]
MIFIGYDAGMPTDTFDPSTPLFVADNLALDFINTEYGEASRHCDCLTSDASVADWLKSTGLLQEDFGPAPKGLLSLARELRANARAIVQAARLGKAADAGVVNRVLEAGRPQRVLQWDGASGGYRLAQHRRKADAASLLEPVAQALADLLTNVSLELVRQCEGDGCTLLFHDQTKSHRRRWCSMATCGNRMKAAAFRSRNR